MGEEQKLSGPDLSEGVALARLGDGKMLLGHAGGEAVLLARRGEEIFAVGATCTHYSGPLSEGLLVDGTVRCPWHHACFDLRTGAPLRAPALNPIPCYEVVRQGERVRVGKRMPEPKPPASPDGAPARIVIVGAGAAGHCRCRDPAPRGLPRPVGADRRRRGLARRSSQSVQGLPGGHRARRMDAAAPARVLRRARDRAGARRAGALCRHRAQASLLESGRTHGYDKLLLATGADPVKLDLPGGDLPHVHYLRTLDDSRAIIAAAQTARRAVVIGSSFIGLEVAASLRARKLEVHVVGPDAVPLGRGHGPGARRLHPQGARGAWRGVPPGNAAADHRRAVGDARQR